MSGRRERTLRAAGSIWSKAYELRDELAESFSDRVDGRVACGDIDDEVVRAIVARS